MSKRLRKPILAAVTSVLFHTALAVAQTGSNIAGVVKDATGALLPGVTVEASSPALIEKVRTVTTDATGQYKILELRPGTYTVTFTLPGFSTVKREGIELTTNFTANVVAELKVGAVEETVTVSGQAPTVDIQSTKQQAVMTRAIVDAIPTGKALWSLGVLIPGVVTSGSTSAPGDVGGGGGAAQTILAIHGGAPGDQQVMVNGLGITQFTRVDTSAAYLTDGNVEEYTMEVSGQSAEAESGGVRINMLPKEGGNAFRGRFFANYMPAGLVSSNLDDRLRASGLTTVNKALRLRNINPSYGGPIRKDRLWFFGTFTQNIADSNVAGAFVNANLSPTARTYVPDLTKPVIDDQTAYDGAGRFTWQATPRNKIGVYLDDNYQCRCHFAQGATIVAPETTRVAKYYVQIYQVTWSSPISNRLLFDFAAGSTPLLQHKDAEPEAIPPAITDSATGNSFRAFASSGFDHSLSVNQTVRGSLTYVTGAHALKVGMSLQRGVLLQEFGDNGGLSIITLSGRPTSVTYYATPFRRTDTEIPNLGLYVQDQWTVKRMTVNAGVRFDHLHNAFEGQTFPATRWLPTTGRSYPGKTVLSWQDLSPRLGVSYDLFGNGNTAVKATASRFVAQIGTGAANTLDPANANSSASRSWTDRNDDFVIDGDPLNPAANDELGASLNRAFGSPVPSVHYDPEYAFGFGKRPFNWEFSGGIQHQLTPGMSVNATYFRRIFGNLTVNDNLAVIPSDFTPYCVPVPNDPRLPSGAGQPLCGLFDLDPSTGKIGLIDNLTTLSSNFGNQYQHWNGVDLTVNAQLRGMLLRGGLSTGRTMTDSCDVHPDSNGSQLFCRTETPFLTQVKVIGSYTLPWDVQAAATLQNIPGPPITATTVFNNAQITPFLGRPLGSGTTASVNIVAPGSLYGERMNQLDLRFSKTVTIAKKRVQAGVDLYNALNGNAVLLPNTTYGTNGASWQLPRAVLPARLVKFVVQVDF